MQIEYYDDGMSGFKHFDLTLVNPVFGSRLTSTIIELDALRNKRLEGNVHPAVFFQLKEIFQLLESLGSARIEGNNTTLSEIVEQRISGEVATDESAREIANTVNAMDFVEKHVKPSSKIDHALIRELHKIVVKDLRKPPAGEGDVTPGMYRGHDVSITNADHRPPSHVHVQSYMDELVEFINAPNEKQYILLNVAFSHHRFAWIHPFGNGNGRVVRLLTYAMLIRQGFNVSEGRILNPTAIFCIDRDKYYAKLAAADRGSMQGLLAWADYVLYGLLDEISKIDNLLDRDYLVNKILIPAIATCRDTKSFSPLQADILEVAAQNMVMNASDIHHLMPKQVPAARSRELRKLKEAGLLIPIDAKGAIGDGGRSYVLSFANSYLLRGVIKALRRENFLGVQALDKPKL